MKEQYGFYSTEYTPGTFVSKTYLPGSTINGIRWFDTLGEAIEAANGEPIIKSIAYEVKES